MTSQPDQSSLAGTNLHKATPGDDNRCGICGQPVKHLPAGQGWVHSDTGAVVGHNPPGVKS